MHISMADVLELVEEELDSYDFDEEDSFQTREGMREVLIKQYTCSHDMATVYSSQGDIPTAVRCTKCGYTVWV